MGLSTRDAAEGSGTASGGRAGRRSRCKRGAPLVEEEAEVWSVWTSFLETSFALELVWTLPYGLVWI